MRITRNQLLRSGSNRSFFRCFDWRRKDGDVYLYLYHFWDFDGFDSDGHRSFCVRSCMYYTREYSTSTVVGERN